MKITREFCPGDRYLYDFGLCSYEKGWAQGERLWSGADRSGV